MNDTSSFSGILFGINSLSMPLTVRGGEFLLAEMLPSCTCRSDCLGDMDVCENDSENDRLRVDDK
jgi:hypothetical protein